ncbi:MAG TPA: NAD(+) diphosphatase [Candidatus Dormibacteraeota bacterium]|nr:NAD(+) diphosphatase [Candidatus Dormibacteraeota bacterium]
MTSEPIGADDAIALAFSEGMLLFQDPERLELPRLGPLLDLAGDPIEVGSRDGSLASLIELEQVPEGLSALGLRDVLARADADLISLASRASQLLEWHHSHAFCGRCAARTVRHPEELARHCPNCGALFFPRINPCVIMLVHRGTDILLARNIRSGRPGFFSLLAGFVEVGETLEHAVRRELLEEVGVEVENPRYQSSQPWPFPSQLMCGFFATYKSGDIVIQESELSEASWYPYDQLPERRPPPYTIAGQLIDRFLSSI